MLASLYPKMVGYGALWRVDPVNVLLAPETPALIHPKTSKVVHAAAATTVATADAISKEKQQLQQQSKQQQESMKRLSINDRLRAIMGDIISEDELEQRFTFGRLLGSGATSKVFAAVDTTTGDEVAIKVFDKAAMVEVRRSMVAEGDYVAEKAVHRVRRRLVKIVSELEISKSLAHPNIIRYIGAYETSHRICIVHELVEGCDLLEHLLANGKMKEAKGAYVFRQLLSALQYCHDRNVYHRDLKLENVLITPDFHVKLIDFGLSEVVAPDQTLKTICGTPLYCSPEVLSLHSSSRQRGFHGGPADVWSIGVLIFALLTGCAPFDDSSFTRLREEVYRNSIAYPAYMSDEVKGMLKALLIFDAQLRPTVKDILAYGYFKEAEAAEKAAALGEASSQINEQGSCEPAAPSATDKVELSPECESPSSKDARRPRSLSALSENRTEGTSSTSGSFEDSDAATSATAQQQQVATHLSCLEIA